MKIFRLGEWLANQTRFGHLSIDRDQAALRLPRENRFRETGHHDGIDDAGENRENNRQAQSRSKFFEHDLLLYARCSATRILSISQIPGNGTMIPPRP